MPPKTHMVPLLKPAISTVEADRNLIKSLVIDSPRLKSIQALTARRGIGKSTDQVRHRGFTADDIEGEGRIIMLHGPPGVGKTYTVECVAKWVGMFSQERFSCVIIGWLLMLGRPMSRITCTELGEIYQTPVRCLVVIDT